MRLAPAAQKHKIMRVTIVTRKPASERIGFSVRGAGVLCGLEDLVFSDLASGLVGFSALAGSSLVLVLVVFASLDMVINIS